MFDPPGGRDADQGTPPDPAVEVETLTTAARTLVSQINADAGRLPAEGVVLARRVTDIAVDVLGGEAAALSTQARLDLTSILTDYLPTTLRTYVAASGAGSAAPDRLVAQIEAIRRSVADIAAAVHGQDVRAFDVQDNFLSQRFTEDVL